MGMADEAEAIALAHHIVEARSEDEKMALYREISALRERLDIRTKQQGTALQALEAAKATLTRGAAALEYVDLAIEALGG